MPKKIIHPVKYVTRQQLKLAGVTLDRFPSAGPRPNVTGMKAKYWGKDALCIRHGAYVYHVPAHIYDKF